MLFNPSQVYMPNRHRQRSAIRTFFPSSSFSPPDSKEPLRRGILFSSVAAVLLLVGAILTWLGLNDVFGGKISMTGPLVIALALLMMLLSLRQFMLARKRNRSTNAPVQMEAVSTGGVTAVVVDHDDGNGAATIVVETWESDEPNNDTIRNNHDLAPPSYMDIAQSCSSNCPSFISHEDHNEAPPTYEETCGLYSSDTSLNGGSTCQFGRPLSPQRTSHCGYDLFQNVHALNQNYDMYNESDQPCRLYSAGPSLKSQSHSSQSPVQRTESNLLNMSFVDPHLSSTVSSNRHVLPCTPQSDSNMESYGTSNKPSDWSRRSFSSIPSYTCLLSESGEVSSHVFDTSSIIEEMMPLLAVQDKVRDPTSTDLLVDPIIFPTRSHSMSSVNTFRQGVPYSSQVSPTTSETVAHPDQFLHGKQAISEDLSPSLVSQNASDVISESSLFLINDAHLRQGSDPHLVDLLTAQPPPTGGSALLQPLSVKTNACSSSLHISHPEETNEQGELLPTMEATPDVQARRKSDSNLTAVSQGSIRTCKLPQTQDVQETI